MRRGSGREGIPWGPESLALLANELKGLTDADPRKPCRSPGPRASL